MAISKPPDSALAIVHWSQNMMVKIATPTPVRDSQDWTKPSATSKSFRRAEDRRNAAILGGRLLRRKRLLLAALRVWELKHRVYD